MINSAVLITVEAKRSEQTYIIADIGKKRAIHNFYYGK